MDARQKHVDDCALIGHTYGIDSLRTVRSDLFNINQGQAGQFEITLLFGLLYHVENPVGALRIAQPLTQGVRGRNPDRVRRERRDGLGVDRVLQQSQASSTRIDAGQELHGPEMSLTGICLYPSLDALLWIMMKVGFARAELVAPSTDACEQHRLGRRVAAAGYCG